MLSALTLALITTQAILPCLITSCYADQLQLAFHFHFTGLDLVIDPFKSYIQVQADLRSKSAPNV